LFARNSTAAVVELLPSGNEIEVRARGPESKEFLNVIAADLDALNASFPGYKRKLLKIVAFAAVIVIGLLISSRSGKAANDNNGAQDEKLMIQIGFMIAPVKLTITNQDPDLVGFGQLSGEHTRLQWLPLRPCEPDKTDIYESRKSIFAPPTQWAFSRKEGGQSGRLPGRRPGFRGVSQPQRECTYYLAQPDADHQGWVT
jgi:hypothetical protein